VTGSLIAAHFAEQRIDIADEVDGHGVDRGDDDRHIHLQASGFDQEQSFARRYWGDVPICVNCEAGCGRGSFGFGGEVNFLTVGGGAGHQKSTGIPNG